MAQTEVSTARQSSRQSLLALDSTNFFLADAETGIGPFIASYLSAVRHWNPAQVGLVNGTQNLAAVLAQAPAGWLIDASTHKRWLIAAAGLVLSLGSLFIVFGPSVPLQAMNQAAVGMALAVLLPGVSAISLGLVGRSALAPRIGRNATLIHIGNALSAVAAGLLSLRGGVAWIFYLSAAFGLITVASVLVIRNEEINNEVARAKDEHSREALPMRTVVRNSALIRFLALIVVFHLASASMLPLAAQEMGHSVPRNVGVYMAACLVVGQLVMAPVAFSAGRLANRTGRKPLFLTGFTALLLRGLLFAWVDAPLGIVFIEVLDGIGTALIGVTTVVTIADFAQGTGRFNALQGIAQAALGVGAFLGKLGSGWLAKLHGYSLTFYALAAIAVAGLLLFALLVPETHEGSSNPVN